MKLVTRLSLLLLLSAAMFTSCKKGAPKQTRHIPKNAILVASINTKAIANKLAKDQATVENVFKTLAGNDTTATNGKKEWEEFQNSGIDLSENLYVAVVQKGGGMTTGGGNAVITGIASLKDAAKLEAYIKKKEANIAIRKEKDFSYASFEGSNMVAWGDDLVVVMNSPQSYGGMEFDSTTGEYSMKPPANNESEMKAEMASYFSMKEDQSVASIPEFRDLMQENADGSFWINSSSSIANMPLPLPKVKELLENSFTAATVNFEEGEVVMNTKSYSSPALRDILKKYSGPTVDLGLINKYPSNNINGFMGLSFNPEMINAIVNYLELSALVDNQLSKILGGTYTLKDITKAIKGDVALVVSDFTMPTVDPATGIPSNTSSPMKMVLNIPVGDKTQMNRLLDKLVEMGLMMKNGNQYNATEAISRTGYQIVADDKNLIVASDAETLSKYKAGASTAGINKDVMGDMKDKTAVFYANIESILNGYPAETSPAAAGSVMPTAKQTFKEVSGYAETFNGKYTEGRLELKLKNDKENSLVSLMKFFGTVGQSLKVGQQPVEVEDIEMIDSTTVE